jgi:HAD superfamily hydrolase (TIGR01509 family)
MKTILVDAVNTFVVDGSINTDLQAMLDTFVNPKIIVTNANADEQVTYGLVDMPYEMFTLSHSPNKPDPLYFETLLEQYNLDAHDVIYFEHNPDAVKSAQSIGIITMQYDHVNRDIGTVKVFLESNL